MKKLLANLPLRQRISIVVVTALAAAALYGVVYWHKESDFKPLYTGLSAEDAGAMVQKLHENGVEYRLPESGGTILVPSAKVAEARLTMATAGLPKSGRIGFELFDKTNLGATEFTEHINYQRAMEGELERSVLALAVVEQARVHITFPKESVFVEQQQPAKASVLVKLRPGAHLTQENVQAIDNLVASAVEGLTPDAVSVLDMDGHLLGRPKGTGGPDGPAPSEETLEYQRKIEADLMAKIAATLDPLLGPDSFRAAVSVDCDFGGGEQSEELFDPARTVMLSSQRSEDSSGTVAPSGLPGTAANLPRPPPRPASSAGRVSRVTENITYQPSRTVKKTRLPTGTVRKISLAILVDQEINWVRNKNSFERVLVPPAPEKLKIIHDVVAGVIGFNAERGDQLVIETLPFENTLERQPPAIPGAPGVALPPGKTAPGLLGMKWDRKTILIAAGAGAGAVLILVGLVFWLTSRKKTVRATALTGVAAPPGTAGAIEGGGGLGIEAKLAERDALQLKAETEALNALKLAPVIAKAAEVMAKHLRERAHAEPELFVQLVRTWMHEEEGDSYS